MVTAALTLERLKSKNSKIKYGYCKELLAIAKEKPILLYPYFNYWAEMVNAPNNILKWTAIDIIGYLSAVDADNKVDNIIPVLLKHLHGGHLITCAHAIFTLALIAQHKPQLRAKVFKEFTDIEADTFNTEECKWIATGHVIKNLKPFITDIKSNTAMMNFIANATRSSRSATKKKADQLLKQIEKAG